MVGVDPDDEDFDAANRTGGTKTVTLTVQQIPKHSHRTLPYMLAYGHQSSEGHTANWSREHQSQKFTTDEAGGGQAHENMPPYITVYFWRRTA